MTVNVVREFFEKYAIQIMAVLIATLGMMSDGMQYAWVSPAVPKLLSNESHIEMTKTETEWIAQCYLIGCAVGAVISFIVFRKISRKFAVFISTIPIATAWIGNLTANSAAVLLASRFIGGMGRNMAFVTVPMYIGEVADPKIRGMLGTFIYIMENVGTVLSYAVTPFYDLSISCTIGLSLALAQMCLIVFLPESPYYLLSKGKSEEAKESLQMLRMRKDVEEELKALTTAVERQTAKKGSFLKLFTVRSNFKALAILWFLRVTQMFSGISVMTMNIHTIFGSVGGNISNNTSAIIYSIMMLTSAMCTIGTMERFGRKTLMIFSCIIAALSLFSEGVYFFLKNEQGLDTSMVSWLPILSMVIYVYGYRVGLGTVPLVMMGELLPVNVKVPGAVLTDIVYTTSSFSANAMFYFTKNHFGMYAPFCIFALVSLVAAIFSKLFVPETRGKTLEEIQFILMNQNEREQAESHNKQQSKLATIT